MIRPGLGLIARSGSGAVRATSGRPHPGSHAARAPAVTAIIEAANVQEDVRARTPDRFQKPRNGGRYE
jgi:hypothetical protein